jgi:hypothetical protein
MGPLWRLWLSISIRLDSIYLRLFVPPRDRPPPIDIPTVFANFVEEYGGEVCDKVEEKSEGKIADYVFRKQNAIAELKCLETDPYYPPAGTNRLWTDLKKAGMSDQEIVDWARGAGSLSRDATWHLATVFRRRIEKIARKAEKQIEATRRSYSMPSARGLLLIANDNNYLFSYPQKFDLISDVFARHFEDSCISGFIFFTPNVPMRIPNSLREWHPWTTSYSGAADDDLVAFVDDLGHHWQRHFLSRESSRSPHFKSSDRRFMRRWMIGAKNVDVRRN